MQTIDGRYISGLPTTEAAHKDYIEIALNILKNAKKINLTLDTFYFNTENGLPCFCGYTSGDAILEYSIPETVFNDDPAIWSKEDHYKDWPVEKRIVLRIAKIFFDDYKRSKIFLSTNPDNVINSQPINNDNGIITKINVGNGIYTIHDARVDIIDNGINTMSKELITAQKRIEELEDRNTKLEKDIQDLNMMKDFMIQALQAKGIL